MEDKFGAHASASQVKASKMQYSSHDSPIITSTKNRIQELKSKSTLRPALVLVGV